MARTAEYCRARQSCRLRKDGLDCVQEDVLLFGGEGAGDLRPEFVPKLNWMLATDFMSGFAGPVRVDSLNLVVKLRIVIRIIADVRQLGRCPPM